MRIKFIANVGLSFFCIVNTNTAAADKPPVGFLRQGQLEISARLLLLLVQKQANKGLDICFGTLSPWIKAQVKRVGLVGQCCLPVVWGKLAQNQPVRREYERACQ